MSRTTEQNARTLIANANRRNVEKVIDQFAEDATYQVPSLERPLEGKEAIRTFLRDNYTAFPDLTMNVSKLIISGGESILVNSVHGTHDGPLTGPDGIVVPATHRRFAQDQLTRILFNNADKVQILRSYGDPADITRQLGIDQYRRTQRVSPTVPLQRAFLAPRGRGADRGRRNRDPPTPG